MYPSSHLPDAEIAIRHSLGLSLEGVTTNIMRIPAFYTPPWIQYELKERLSKEMHKEIPCEARFYDEREFLSGVLYMDDEKNCCFKWQRQNKTVSIKIFRGFAWEPRIWSYD